MRRRKRADLEDWEQDAVKALVNNLAIHEDILDDIELGNRLTFESLDVTDEEFRKSSWIVAFCQAELDRIEYTLANDNRPPADEELQDLLAGEW